MGFARQNVKMAEKISKKSTSVMKRSRVVAKAAVSVPTTLKAGVVTGQDFIDVMNHARHHGYAIPAVLHHVFGDERVLGSGERSERADDYPIQSRWRSQLCRERVVKR